MAFVGKFRRCTRICKYYFPFTQCQRPVDNISRLRSLQLHSAVTVLPSTLPKVGMHADHQASFAASCIAPHKCDKTLPYQQLQRYFSVGPTSEEEVRQEVDRINDKFAEAREEIEMALESKETVYFNEEAETARVAVKEVIDRFQDLLNKVDANQRGGLQRSMGLKMEQLKGELEQLNH